MKKQHSEKEQDMNTVADAEQTNNTTTQGECSDNMAEGNEGASANMSVEPTLEEQLAVWRDKYLRLQAEFDNFRKRTIKEKMELVERGSEGAWKAVLPILDDMERAVAASAKSEDIEALREGEMLVMKKFESVLQAQGITRIECVGQPFNEEEQEAVARFAASEDMRGKVIDCVQQGYKMGEHVLRYAKVVVGE
jgi:molecular chaperone GrpE